MSPLDPMLTWNVSASVTNATTHFYNMMTSLDGGRRRNAMQVTTLGQIQAMKAGDRLVVRQDGGEETVGWVSDGEGNLTSNEATLPASAFSDAVLATNVFFPGQHEVGQTVAGIDGYVYRILGKEGDTWMLARCDNDGRQLSIIEGEPLGTLSERPNQYRENALGILAELYARRKDADLLNQILDAGEVPAEVDYIVEVEVTGTSEVTPTSAVAARLLGYKGAKVADVDPFTVNWVKVVSIRHLSRWGCACEQVSAEEVSDAVHAEQEHSAVLSYKILGCVGEGGQTHEQAEPTAQVMPGEQGEAVTAEVELVFDPPLQVDDDDDDEGDEFDEAAEL